MKWLQIGQDFFSLKNCIESSIEMSVSLYQVYYSSRRSEYVIHPLRDIFFVGFRYVYVMYTLLGQIIFVFLFTSQFLAAL